MEKNQAIELILSEYSFATTKFPKFNGSHEGYAVILEELDELWDCIKGNVDPKLTKNEAVQVATMALRFLTDCC